MDTTDGLTLRLSKHAITQAVKKGFTPQDITAAFENPDEIYPNGRYPGQYRICGKGICMTGVPQGTTFRVITMYADRVLTPPREDQMNTAKGRRYAERYAAGMGRG